MDKARYSRVVQGSMIDEVVLGRLANTCFHMSKKDDRSVIDVVESFRPNQIKCKKWLVEEIANINPNWNRVLVLGSWNSILLWELAQVNFNVGWFDFLDNHPLAHKHRDMYFEVNGLEKNYSSIVMNAEDFSDHSSYDLIINTSCEHMPDIPAEYGPTYALQSNNYTSIKEHINCVKSEKQLAKQNNLTHILFKGSKKMPNYDRFMAIGYFA
jgi:hypothetical protein